jgi:hypothetical protein
MLTGPWFIVKMLGIVFSFVLAVVAYFSLLRNRNDESGIRFVRKAVLAAGICSGVVLVLGVLEALQASGHVTLLPGTLSAHAKQWLFDHQMEPPERKQVGRNLKILKDGVVFYQAHKGSLPVEARVRFESMAQVPTKVDHVLSIAEEGKFHRAAEQMFELIRVLAKEPESKATPGN